MAAKKAISSLPMRIFFLLMNQVLKSLCFDFDALVFGAVETQALAASSEGRLKEVTAPESYKLKLHFKNKSVKNDYKTDDPTKTAMAKAPS